MTERLEGSRETQRESAQKQEQGFVTPDGSARTRQRDREWAEALEAAGGIQIESFNPVEVINIAALQAKLKARVSTPAAPETPPDSPKWRWNVGTCKTESRPHLENEHHICRNWKSSKVLAGTPRKEEA